MDDRTALMKDRLLEAALETRGLSFSRAIPEEDCGRFSVWIGHFLCGLVYERDGRWWMVPADNSEMDGTIEPVNGWRSRVHAATQFKSIRDLMDVEIALALHEALDG